jgi:predicted ATPase
MPVSELWVQRYRSLLEVTVPFSPLTVLHGANGSGKTNLYRALLLLNRAAAGRLAQTLLEEGGMPSAQWAGESGAARRKQPRRVVIGVRLEELSYEIGIGLPALSGWDPFRLDPEVKEEKVWIGSKRSKGGVIADRAGMTATALDVDGAETRWAVMLDPGESLLAQLSDPARFPELFGLRERLRCWRFYHHFRTDPAAPARRPAPGVRTTVLADDGNNLAAALATINQIGDRNTLDQAIENAFPGTTLEISAQQGVFAILLRVPGLLRAVSGQELSDGTLRYLYLAAALLSPRPPELLVLNEPETSLHSGLIAPLANLIAESARYGQIVVTTHSSELSERLEKLTSRPALELIRGNDGATQLQT